MSVALLAAFAVGAVPAFLAPQAGADIYVSGGYSSSIPDTQSHDYVTVAGDYTGAASLTVESGGALTVQQTLDITGGHDDNGYNGYNGGAASLTVESGGALTAQRLVISGGIGRNNGTGGSAEISGFSGTVNGTIEVTGGEGRGGGTEMGKGGDAKIGGNFSGAVSSLKVTGSEGDHGSGGSAEVSGFSGTVTDTIEVSGGRGKAGGTGGDAKIGGNFSGAVSSLKVTGGEGGRYGTGGSAEVSGFSGTVNGTIEVTGGEGRGGGTEMGKGGDAKIGGNFSGAVSSLKVTGGEGRGGSGGSAEVSGFSGTVTSLTVTGGKGDLGGGGGAASVSVTGTLRAETIDIAKGADGSGGASGGAATLNVGTLDVTGNGTNMTLNGTAANNVKFTNVKLGGQTLTATGINGGEATIETLTLTGAGLLADSGGALKIGKLAFDGGTLDDNNWDGLVGAGRTYTSTNDITLENGGLTVDLTSGSSIQTLDRKLTGTGALTKTGAGMVTLSAANDYSGGTQVQGGTLELKDANAAGTDGVNVESGATLALDFSGDYDKPIAGTGTVHLAQNATILKLKDGDIRNQITGAGGVVVAAGAGKTLILNNANSYAGGTEVQTGTLELKDANAAGKGTVDVAGGATLRLSASGTYTNSALQGASGSTLEVTNTGVSVQKIDGFQNLYFILPTNTNANDTMLTVNGGAATQFTAAMTNVGVGIAGGGSALQAGDQVTLLTNPVGLHNASGGELVQGTDYQLVTTGTQGFSLSHDFELSNDANSLHATVKTPPSPPTPPQPTPPQPTPPQPTPPQPTPPQPTPPQPTPPQPTPPAPQVDPRTKAVPESRVAVMGMLNLGADQIVRMTGNLPNRTGGGAPNFGGSDNKGAGAPNDTSVFAQISGHRQKLESGSHVNVNGAAAIVGAAKAIPLAGGGTAAVGAFFEYGDGSFKTHNDFAIGDVNGKGDSDYYGAGVLARVNLAGSGNGAPFVEGSLHAGSIHNNWHTDDLRDAATGQRAQYDIRTPYMGAHVGAGYRWQTGAASHVEAYGQYLYTHMDGKDTNVALDPYHFNAVKSSRTRLGAKGTWAVSQQTQAYAGAAWEREFDGTARATAYSFDVPAPTMKGNSAVIDAGLTFQPRQNLTTNVGVTGYAGKRKGASANVEVQYLF